MSVQLKHMPVMFVVLLFVQVLCAMVHKFHVTAMIAK